MEALKGGGMAQLPAAAEKIIQDAESDKTVASWWLRFAANLEGTRAILSGMSTLAQMEDNIKTAKEYAPLTEGEKAILFDTVKACRAAGKMPPSFWEKYAPDSPHGVALVSILDAYNTMGMQPIPASPTTAIISQMPWRNSAMRPWKRQRTARLFCRMRRCIRRNQ